MSFLKIGDPIPEKGKGSKLSHKQEKFVEFLLADPDRNATQAALKAGYITRNANRIGTQLLLHPLVRRKIDEEDNARRERMQFSADFLLQKLMDIINEDGIKTADQIRAIELAGKSIALWKERQEISGPDGQAIEMEQRTKESVADFTSKLSRISQRNGTDGVVEFPKREGEGRT